MTRNCGSLWAQTVLALVPDANAHNGVVNGVNVGVNPAIAPILRFIRFPPP